MKIFQNYFINHQINFKHSNETFSAGNEYTKRIILLNHFHLVNNVSHRFNSSSGDGNVKSLNFDEFPFRKRKKSKKNILRTSVTEGMNSVYSAFSKNKKLIPKIFYFIFTVFNNSSNVKQESVGLIRKKSLERFVLDSLSNQTQIKSTKTNSNDHHQSVSMTMKEKPILFTSNDYGLDPVKHKALIENLPNSLNEFVNRKSKSNPSIDERSVMVNETTTKTKSVNEELQKNFQSDSFRFQASIKDSLLAYINACVTVDMTERAFSVLNEYRRKTIDGKKSKLNDPELFIELMAKYAMGKNLQKVNRIYAIMLEENCSITPQIYMLMLSCMGRSPGNNKLIKKCIEMAAQKVNFVN